MIISFLGQLYGLEKFWAFLKYYKNANKLHVDPKLEEHLSKFNTIEDFRVVEPQLDEMLQGVGNLRQSPSQRRHRSISESEGFMVSTHNRRPSAGSNSGGGGGGNSGGGGHSAGGSASSSYNNQNRQR